MKNWLLVVVYSNFLFFLIYFNKILQFKTMCIKFDCKSFLKSILKHFWIKKRKNCWSTLCTTNYKWYIVHWCKISSYNKINFHHLDSISTFKVNEVCMGTGKKNLRSTNSRTPKSDLYSNCFELLKKTTIHSRTLGPRICTS